MEEQLDFNAFLESFAIHARNLTLFLSASSQTDACNATDHVTDFEARTKLVYSSRLFGWRSRS